MSFTPKNWQNLPSTTTPINAAALTDLETRLAAYTDSKSATVDWVSMGIYRPQDYGTIDPTGVADSTTAFQACLDALTASPYGGRMVIPPGTYLVGGLVSNPTVYDSAHRWGRNTRAIVGAGRGATMLKAKPGVNAPILSVIGDESGSTVLPICDVKDISFNSNGQTIPSCLKLRTLCWSKFENIWIDGGPACAKGIHGSGLITSSFDGVWVFGVQEGIYCTSGGGGLDMTWAANCLVFRNIVAGCPTWGLHLLGGGFWDLNGHLDFESCGTGISTGITGSAATDTFTYTNHGLTNDTPVSWRILSVTTDFSLGKVYYVRNATANTFQLATSVGGAPINITADISNGQLGQSNTGGIKIEGGEVHQTGVLWFELNQGTDLWTSSGMGSFTMIRGDGIVVRNSGNLVLRSLGGSSYPGCNVDNTGGTLALERTQYVNVTAGPAATVWHT